jgi:hypothetical protein
MSGTTIYYLKNEGCNTKSFTCEIMMWVEKYNNHHSLKKYYTNIASPKVVPLSFFLFLMQFVYFKGNA